MSAEAGDSPLFFPTIPKWRAWLRRNHARPGGTWVLLAKKGTQAGISYKEALEEALCWGWIDGKIHRHDQLYFAQWFAPRRARSIWSLANKTTVQRLIAEGRMQKPGLERIEEAKANGQWKKAYASRLTPPMSPDIRKALKDSGLWEAWQKTAPSRKLMLLYWVSEAKRPETRARRIAELPTLVRENRLAGFSS
jgi:uncharacterized protein YdeI (YjbR/CyaY-like superfamily)